jgi:hypothetical protein
VKTSNSTIRLGILLLHTLASSYKQNLKIEAVKGTVASVLKCPPLQKYFLQIAAVLSAYCCDAFPEFSVLLFLMSVSDNLILKLQQASS